MKEKNDHPLNWKETQKILDPDVKQPWIVGLVRNLENHKYPMAEKIIRSIAKLVFLIRPLRRASERSAGGTFGAIIKYTKAENYPAAYEAALGKLKDEKLIKNEVMLGHHLWWQFMSSACQSLEKFESAEKREELILLMFKGPEPLQGYDVSNSLCHAARWRFGTHQEIEALDLARRARDADPTFYYAWYLLGWFSLQMRREDAESYFIKAIELDQTIWPVINQDPMCSREVEMLRSLKERALAKGIALKG